MKPKVTVTMAAYNTARFIGEAIESVLAQEYKDWELLIIDDGSTDNTAQIIRSYAEKEPKIRWFRKKHEGIGATRNQLVKHARGKYISICDADDKILPQKLKKHVDILDKYPSVVVVYGEILTVDEYGRSASYPILVPKVLNKWWDLLENAVTHNSSTIRKSAILKVGGYDETTAASEDYDLWLKLAEIGSFKCLHEPFAVSRFYSWSTSAKNTHRFYSDVIRVKKNAILRRYGKHFAGKFKW